MARGPRKGGGNRGGRDVPSHRTTSTSTSRLSCALNVPVPAVFAEVFDAHMADYAKNGGRPSTSDKKDASSRPTTPP